MAKENAEAPAPLPGKNPKKGGKKGLLIGVVLAVVLLAGGGGAAYWKWGMAHAADPAAEGKAAAEGHGAAKAGEELGMVPFEPFLVNLADEGGQSYLRATLSLLVASEETAKALEAKPVTRTQIRSAVLEVLSTHTASQVATPEGKVELKRAIKERVEKLGLEIEVRDVLFSDFVVQY
jgi:flagellar FliL protein